MVKLIADEELQLKVRARHRLIGAIALVVALVVVVPMVFDSTPRQEKSEIPIQIPAPESAPPFNPKFEPSVQAENPPASTTLDVKPGAAGQSANSVARSATEPVKSPLPPATVTQQSAVNAAAQLEENSALPDG